MARCYNRLDIRWVTESGFMFTSEQVTETICFNADINKWLIDENLEFLTLQEAIAYVEDCHK